MGLNSLNVYRGDDGKLYLRTCDHEYWVRVLDRAGGRFAFYLKKGEMVERRTRRLPPSLFSSYKREVLFFLDQEEISIEHGLSVRPTSEIRAGCLVVAD